MQKESLAKFMDEQPPLEEARKNIDEIDDSGSAKLLLSTNVLVYSKGSFQENAIGIRQFYNTFTAEFSSYALYCLIDGSGRFKKVKPEHLELVPSWATGENGNRTIFGIDLESAGKSDSVSDRAYQMYFDGGDPGFLRTVLPAAMGYTSPGKLLALTLESLEHLRFSSCYAGFGINMKRGFLASVPGSRVDFIGKRFQGVHLGRPLMFARYVENAIQCAAWLTGVGNEFLAGLGGLDFLKKNLGTEVTIHRLEHGILLQAGERPRLGDVNRQECLTEWHDVAKSIAKLKISSEVLGPYDGIGGSESTQNWLTRFDEK